MREALVTCDNLVKVYKVPEADVEVVALQGLDLDTQPGELLAIVGQSGSGKTTVLNILGALDVPTAGACTVAGYSLTRLGERERVEYRRYVVGHMWQQSGRNLVPDLSLEENVSLPQMLAGVGPRERRERSRAVLAQVGLGELRDKLPEQLSGGEQQRGAIAVALANEPSLLLADEPTGELDSETAQGVVALLHRLTRELGLTVVLVTHDPAVAAQADRTIAIRDGRTSTETVPRGLAGGQQMSAGNAQGASALTGLPASTHRESILVDRAGRLQLPEDAVLRLRFEGRAELWIGADHVELWPVGLAAQTSQTSQTVGAGATGSAVIGLPADAFREAVVIDRVGRLQLSEEALNRVPFGRHATVRVADDHLELWPVGG